MRERSTENGSSRGVVKLYQDVLDVGSGLDALEVAKNYIHLAHMASNQVEGDDEDAIVTICSLAFEQLMVARTLFYEAIGRAPPEGKTGGAL